MPGATATHLSPVVKASFNLPREELAGLKSLAKKRSVSVTQALRQAIATERFLAEQPAGSRVFIEDPEGNKREVVFRG